MLALLAAIHLAAAPPQDSLPRISLAEALERAARLDPDYVSATRQIADAEWGRRAALTAFVIPAISAQLNATWYSSATFNIGTGEPAAQIVDARLEGRLNIFAGLSKFNELTRSAAELGRARAGELDARFQTALLTESEYYDVIAQRELTRVATERVRRAEEQLAVARARVVSGAAVQTDSLQLLLEVTEARVALLRREAQLKVAQFQLARRVGAPGPVHVGRERGVADQDALRTAGRT